eukprot:14395415-Alexandrium_andersonii.AAC.1
MSPCGGAPPWVVPSGSEERGPDFLVQCRKSSLNDPAPLPRALRNEREPRPHVDFGGGGAPP